MYSIFSFAFIESRELPISAKNVFKENLFDEQESVQDKPEPKNDVLNSDEQNQILPKDEPGYQKIPKKPVQQTFDLS